MNFAAISRDMQFNHKFFLLLLVSSGLFYISRCNAQVLTGEDSLYAGLVSREQATILSGYGEARYSLDTKRKNAETSLSRVVLFVGHKFNKKISLFTELELEDALVIGQSGDEAGIGKGGISMEQAFLKINIDPTTYIVAGLFIPRIGFINENHLPTTFNGVDRPFLEELIIPSTWREVGVGLYGGIKSIAGLNYSFSLTNGLNASGFSNGSGIRGGRQLGSAATGLGLGVSGSLLYYINDFRFQLSGYVGAQQRLKREWQTAFILIVVLSGILFFWVILTHNTVKVAGLSGQSSAAFKYRMLPTSIRLMPIIHPKAYMGGMVRLPMICCTRNIKERKTLQYLGGLSTWI